MSWVSSAHLRQHANRRSAGRTDDWDEFPNGRWGDARSPAFGELSDSHFYRFTLGNVEDRKAMLGENPTALQDVYDVFGDYILGKIPLLPWCEQSLQPER